MRILFWCDAFWPLIGGIEVLAARLVTALRDRGHELCVVTRREPNHRAYDLFNDIPVHRVQFLEVRNSRNIDQWVATREQIATIKREFRPDIVHVYHATIDVLFHLVTSSAHRAPTLCTVHGIIDEDSLKADTTVDRLLRSADWVTTCSAATLAETRQHIPALTSRSSVILNGLDTPRVVPMPISFEPPTVLCVGRIGTVEEKGFDLAIHAVALLRARFPQLRLRIAGDGPARRMLEQVACDAEVSDIVDFLGAVHPDHVPTLINESSMLLMPSRVAEGFGLVALQAAQMERPVIASRVGGVPEVVSDGETGLLVEPNDAAALARAIETLLDNPLHATQLGLAGRRRALTDFTLVRHVDEYEQLLHRLAFPTTRVMSLA